MDVVDEIMAAKSNAGKDAHLQISAGNCYTLWDKNPLSGHRAKILGYWILDSSQMERLALLMQLPPP